MTTEQTDRKAAVEALAESWASIDGNQGLFVSGKDGDDWTGHYKGYLCDAEELLARAEKRGFTIVRRRDAQQ